MAKNLAGLAALGALGVILRNKMGNKQKDSGAFYEAGSGPTAETAPVDDNGAFYEAGSGPTGAALARNPGPIDDESQFGVAVPGQVAYRKPFKQTATKPSQAASTSSYGSRYPTPAQRLTTSNDPRVNPDFDPTSAQGAGPSSYPTQGTRPSTGNIGPTMRSPRGDMIPGQSVRAPQGGERVDSTELSRNLFNGLNALGAAGKLAGVGKMATEAATMGRVQRAYNAQQAARRAAEGLSPAEAAAARQRLSEAAFEGGMKKGGSVKAKGKSKSVKMASGGSARSSASKRGDGIASKGRTRGKMY
jgi:hypothetical protein